MSNEELKIIKKVLSVEGLPVVTKNDGHLKIHLCMSCKEHFLGFEYKEGGKDRVECKCGAVIEMKWFKNGNRRYKKIN
jgi:hypothetical protein